MIYWSAVARLRVKSNSKVGPLNAMLSKAQLQNSGANSYYILHIDIDGMAIYNFCDCFALPSPGVEQISMESRHHWSKIATKNKNTIFYSLCLDLS